MRWLRWAVLLSVACARRLPAAPADAPRDEWSPLTWEERHDVMTFAVLPNTARAFQRFRGTESPDMTCRTYHGADAEAVQYKMPHGLPPLDRARLPRAEDSPIAKFMIEEVTLQMKELTGAKEVTCFTCHPAK